MPPFGLLPALVVSLGVAVWLMDGAATGRHARPRRALAAALDRLGLGLRLPHRRPVVARLGLPGRGGGIPLGAAPRRARPAGRARAVLRRRLRAGAAALVARRRRASSPSRVGLAACEWLRGPPLHRVSLEHARHGARPEPLADAGRVRGRPLRPDRAGDRSSRGARDPGRRPTRARALRPRPLAAPAPSLALAGSAPRACRRRRARSWRACACASSSRT